MYFKDIKMLQRTKIVKVLASERPLDEVLVKGWVRTRRDAKDYERTQFQSIVSLQTLQKRF